jgi:hypothetical protein
MISAGLPSFAGLPQLHHENMAIFSTPFLFGSRASWAMVLSDDDDRPEVSKALLAGEDGYDSESPPPYRQKHWRAISIYGLGAASTFFIGLIILCFFWHMATLKAKSHGTALPEIQPSSMMNAGTSNSLANDEAIVSEHDEAFFAGWKDCGSNVTEARAKGCFFDVMLHSWIHEDCVDRELMEEYLTKKSYHWYRDWKSKEEITVDEMRRGEHGSAAVENKEHATHCAYVLEKNLKAIMNGKPVARSIYSVRHEMHCLAILVDPSSTPGIYTKVVIEYDQCGIPHFD